MMFGNALAGDTKTLQLIGIAHIQIMLQNIAVSSLRLIKLRLLHPSHTRFRSKISTRVKVWTKKE